MRFKIFLWKLGFYKNNCPYCNEQLVQHYAPDGSLFVVYDCYTKDCKFNEV